MKPTIPQTPGSTTNAQQQQQRPGAPNTGGNAQWQQNRGTQQQGGQRGTTGTTGTTQNIGKGKTNLGQQQPKNPKDRT